MNKLLVSITIIIGIIFGTGCTFDSSALNIPYEAPTNLKVSKGKFENKIRVTFNPVNDYTGGYVMCYSTKNYTSDQLRKFAKDFFVSNKLPKDLKCKQLDNTDVFFTVIQPTQTYHVWVAAISTKAKIAHDTGYSTGILAKPKNFKANGQFSSTKITLSWESVTNAKRYEIYRKIEGKAYKNLPTSPQTNNNGRWTDTTAKQGIRYVYKIKACNGDVCSSFAYSKAVSLRPSKPDFVCQSTSSDTIVLFFTLNEPVEHTTYKIQRSSSLDFTGRPTVSSNNMGIYSDTGLPSNRVFYYRVRTYNAKLSRSSGWSDKIKCTTKSQ